MTVRKCKPKEDVVVWIQQYRLCGALPNSGQANFVGPLMTRLSRVTWIELRLRHINGRVERSNNLKPSFLKLPFASLAGQAGGRGAEVLSRKAAEIREGESSIRAKKTAAFEPAIALKNKEQLGF